MKAISIEHSGITHRTLLKLADTIPGAWLGIRIAALILILHGWKRNEVAALFGISRVALLKWVKKANQLGLKSVKDLPRTGRPGQFTKKQWNHIDKVLQESPQKVGIMRSRWDGIVLTEYIQRTFKKRIHVRYAQMIIRKMGYTLRWPVHQYVQATRKGVRAFKNALKKTPDGSE